MAAPTSNERVVVELAFDGGQIMGARLTSESADELEKALADRHDGALTLDADDGRYTIPLARVEAGLFQRFLGVRVYAGHCLGHFPLDGLRPRRHDPVEPANLGTGTEAP